MIAGCQRYAAQCGAKGQTGTQYVSSPKKFFTLPECRFKESFPLPAASSERGKPSPPTEVERLQKLNDRRAGTRHLQNFRDPNPGETADQYLKAQDEEWKRFELEEGRKIPRFPDAKGLAAAKRMPV